MLDTMLTLEVIIAILLSIIILIQNKNVSLNLSSMSGWTGTNTRRWPEKILHNLTIFLAILFIANSTLLFVIQSNWNTNNNKTTQNIDLSKLNVKQIQTSTWETQNTWATIKIKEDNSSQATWSLDNTNTN